MKASPPPGLPEGISWPAESAADSQESCFRQIIEGFGDPILMLDRDYLVRYANRAFGALLGLRPPDILAVPFLPLLPEDEAGQFDRLLRGVLEDRSRQPGMEHRLKRSDGGWELFETTINLLAGPSGSPMFVLHLRCITRLKQAGQERIAREAAKAANAAKGMFLANMSHEIRTPLNAVIGFSQILSRDRTLNEKQRHQLEIIARSGEHLLALINDILDFSKIEAHRLSLNAEPFSLRGMLEALTQKFAHQAETAGISLTVTAEPALPDVVKADQAKIRQILFNLVSNALKFTPGGTVKVRADVLSSAGPGSSTMLRFSVEDTGIGIAETELEQIFDVFHQAGAGSTASGTGLGLAISRRLAELMGGSLTVASRIGAGSRFTFTVSVETGGYSEKPAAHQGRIRGIASGPGAGTKRVLIVDDSADNRALLKELLESVGFTAAEAGSGAEAVPKAAELIPHVILMDMKMPGMNGYEAAGKIRQIVSCAHVPVVAVTASIFESDLYLEKEAGIVGCLRKPVREEELFRLLGAVLDISYVYEEDPAAVPEDAPPSMPTKERVGALPAELRSAAAEAVEIGDRNLLFGLIHDVEELDPQLGRQLNDLARKFDYETLLELLADERKDGGN